ncbi:BolA/IbaG family iron-sulfur metabolism protein [Saccharophagus degradans]|uniref:BolA family protein n=1 Tax=Saccharophagus degradans TaxID=86304 RepID=UPI001C09D903|nr:BolA/IbaG family iron-sulfur metabolism protein [Saccharophagus degradans]MBU2985972.1 BolA/IbaG family iron-sulfur metabolism protein [Saccharophagus degradans]
MPVQPTIQQKLQLQFSPVLLEVLNESHGHNVAKGSETHFKVIAVSEAFEGLGLVKRHQAVYAALADELASGVHALALHLFTPSEWEANKADLASPKCMGGSKK